MDLKCMKKSINSCIVEHRGYGIRSAHSNDSNDRVSSLAFFLSLSHNPSLIRETCLL